jgi:hypothetical protein
VSVLPLGQCQAQRGKLSSLNHTNYYEPSLEQLIFPSRALAGLFSSMSTKLLPPKPRPIISPLARLHKPTRKRKERPRWGSLREEAACSKRSHPGPEHWEAYHATSCLGNASTSRRGAWPVLPFQRVSERPSSGREQGSLAESCMRNDSPVAEPSGQSSLLTGPKNAATENSRPVV